MGSNKKIRMIPRWVDLAITAGFVVLGVALLLLIPSNLYVGFTVIAIGVLVICCFRTGFKIEGKEGIFVRKQFVLPSEARDEIVAFLQGDDEKLALQPFRMGGMLMNVYTTKTQMLCQLLINDTECFVPQSDLIETNQAKLDEVLKYATK